MKQYNTNLEIKKSIMKTQYKKHPKWGQRKIVRIILLILPIAIGGLIYANLDLSNSLFAETGFDKVMQVSIAVCCGVIGIIPWLIYIKTLRATCSCVVNYRQNDTLILDENEIKYIYHPENQYDLKIYQELDMKYEDIRKVVYNVYHNRLDIYGRLKEIWYSDFEKGKVGRTKNQNKEDTRIRLYLYFNNSEDILSEIKVKSPVRVEEINYSEE